MQREREETLRRQNDSPNEVPESTKPLCSERTFQAISEKDLKELTGEHMKREEAVTYWSHTDSWG